MRVSFACLLLGLVSVGHFGTVADATVMSFFRVPWSWFGYAEESKSPLQPAAIVEVSIQPVSANEPELGAEPRETEPETGELFTTTERPSSLPPAPAAALRELPIEIAGSDEINPAYYEGPIENVDVGFEPDTSMPLSYSNLNPDLGSSSDSYSTETEYPPNQPYIRPLMRRMGEIRSPTPKVEAETTVEPDSPEVLVAEPFLLVEEEEEETNSTAEEVDFDKDPTIVDGDIIVNKSTTLTEASTTTESNTDKETTAEPVEAVTEDISLVMFELEADKKPKLEPIELTSTTLSEEKKESEVELFTTTSTPPTTAKLIKLLKEAAEVPTTTEPAPVFRPEVHLKNESEEQSGSVKVPEAPQFLYNGDFAAELHRLYYSKPIFDKSAIEFEGEMKPLSPAGRSLKEPNN